MAVTSSWQAVFEFERDVDRSPILLDRLHPRVAAADELREQDGERQQSAALPATARLTGSAPVSLRKRR